MMVTHHHQVSFVIKYHSPGLPHQTPPFLTIIKYHLSSSITYQLIQWYNDTMIQITVSLSNSITISVDQLISDISSVIKYHLSVDTVIQWYSDTVIQWYSDAVIQWYKSKFMQKSKAWYYCFSIYNDTNRNPVPEIEIQNPKSRKSKPKSTAQSQLNSPWIDWIRCRLPVCPHESVPPPPPLHHKGPWGGQIRERILLTRSTTPHPSLPHHHQVSSVIKYHLSVDTVI